MKIVFAKNFSFLRFLNLRIFLTCVYAFVFCFSFISQQGHANQLSNMERNGARRNCISIAIQGRAFDSARLLSADEHRPSVDYLLPKKKSRIY